VFAVTTGALRPGGTQPGGGSKALFGSDGLAGAAATAIGADDSVTGGVAVVVTGGVAGVVTGGDGGGAAAALSTGGGTAVVVTAAGGGTAAGVTAAADAGAEAGEVAAGGGGAAACAAASEALRSAARRSASARALASRAALSLAIASCCAFWPPLPATTEPICGPLRVSSTGATPESYCRPELADGNPLATTAWSAPGRTCLLLTGVLPSNQSQLVRLASSAMVETPRSRLPRRPPPIMSRYPRIVVIRSFIGARSLVPRRPRL